MSGGSYNYLASMVDLEDAERKLDDLRAMAARLSGLDENEFPGSDAVAARTLAFIAQIELWQAHANATSATLGPAWKAVEWWDSCDWGPSQVKDALQEVLTPNINRKDSE